MNDENQPDHSPSLFDAFSAITEDYHLVMIPLYATVIADDMPDHIREMRFSALQEMARYLHHYESLGYMQELLCGIARKKGEKIMSVTTKADMQKLLKPRRPHFDGNKFIPDPLIIPEEELICWSLASYDRPPGDIAIKRIMELFQQVFPEWYQRFFGEEYLA